jgi:hypothetical protein
MMNSDRTVQIAHDGELDEWLPFTDAPDGFLFIVGTVTSDRKQRFANGALMTTSFIRADLSELIEGAVIATLNSVYFLHRRANRPSFDAFLYAASLGGTCLDGDNQPFTSFAIANTTGSADQH